MVMNKRGGMELSMTTIVIIVISIIILIFGIIFGRNIMCSGIRLTEKLNDEVMNEIIDIFGSDKLGVSCQGEEELVKLGTGKRVNLFCGIKVDQPTSYRIVADDPQLLLGNERKKAIPRSWILSKGTNDVGVQPGEIKYQSVLTLNIPRNAERSTAELNLKVYDKNSNDPSSYETHTIQFDIVPLNFIQTTMC